MRASTLPGVFAGTALVAYVATGALAPLSSNDVWIHLTTGRLILQEGQVPRTDRYSFTAAGNRYVAHEWLAAATYALGDRIAGTTGVIFAGKLLPSLALLAALFLAMRAAGARAETSLPLALLVLTLARHRIIARPELLALVLAVTTVWLLLRDRRQLRAGGSRRALLWLTPIAALWANLHGSFPIGIALVAIFAAAELGDRLLAPRDSTALLARAVGSGALLLGAAWLAGLQPAAFGRPAALVAIALAALVVADAFGPIFARPTRAVHREPAATSLRPILPLLVVAVLMTAAVAANPRGLEIYRFPFEFTSGVTAVTRNIEEWKPLLDAPLLSGTVAFSSYLWLLAIFSAALALAARRGRLGLLELALCAALGVLPLRHARWMALFALATAPALCATLEAARAGHSAPAAGGATRTGAALPLGALALAAVALALRDMLSAPPDAAARATGAVAALGGILALASVLRAPLPRHLNAIATGAGAAGLVALAALHGIPEVPGYPRRPVLGVRAAEPFRPVEFLRRHQTRGRLFTEYDWAGYVIYKLHPDVSVFIDSRSEVYGDQLLLEYRDVKLSQSAARRAFERHDVDLVLVKYEPYPGTVFTNPGVLGAVESDAHWGLLYVDDGAVLYARRDRGRALPPSFEKLRPRHLRPGDPALADPELEGEARRALELAPGSAFLRTLLAASLHARGRDGEARSELERAFRSNPRYPGAPQLAGELAAAAGDRESARRWFRHAQAAYPGWSAPARALAELER